MKVSRRAMVLALALVLTATACGDGGDNGGAGEASGVGAVGTEDEFVFGGSFTLSGPAAFLGVLEKSGVELAIEQFNKGECIVQSVPPQPCEGGGLRIGGKTVSIKFKSYDDASDARKAIDNVNRLVEQDKSRAVWGPRMNDAVVAAASLLEPRGIIEVCSICSSPAMTVGRKFGFDITDTGVLEKHAMGAFINEPDELLTQKGVDPAILKGRKKTAIIGRDELYVVHGAEGWKEAMAKEGGRGYQFDIKRDVVLYPFGTTDFAPFVAKLAALDPDVVLMDVYVIPDMIAIMKEMLSQKNLDFTTGETMLLGNDVMFLQFFVDSAKQEGIDTSGGYVWGWQEQNPGVENPQLSGLFDQQTLDQITKYTEVYNAKYKGTDAETLGPFARGSYDAAMWLLFALEKAGTITDNEKIVEAWKSLKLDGLRGPGSTFFNRSGGDEATGQLFVTEYIMGINKESTVFYTGISYRDNIYFGPWVSGDELPKGSA